MLFRKQAKHFFYLDTSLFPIKQQHGQHPFQCAASQHRAFVCDASAAAFFHATTAATCSDNQQQCDQHSAYLQKKKQSTIISDVSLNALTRRKSFVCDVLIEKRLFDCCFFVLLLLVCIDFHFTFFVEAEDLLHEIVVPLPFLFEREILRRIRKLRRYMEERNLKKECAK